MCCQIECFLSFFWRIKPLLGELPSSQMQHNKIQLTLRRCLSTGTFIFVFFFFYLPLCIVSLLITFWLIRLQLFYFAPHSKSPKLCLSFLSIKLWAHFLYRPNLVRSMHATWRNRMNKCIHIHTQSHTNCFVHLYIARTLSASLFRTRSLYTLHSLAHTHSV